MQSLPVPVGVLATYQLIEGGRQIASGQAVPFPLSLLKEALSHLIELVAAVNSSTWEPEEPLMD